MLLSRAALCLLFFFSRINNHDSTPMMIRSGTPIPTPTPAMAPAENVSSSGSAVDVGVSLLVLVGMATSEEPANDAADESWVGRRMRSLAIS